MVMRYSRLGVYVPRIKKEKVKPNQNKKKRVDWINIALFGLLFIVIVLFIST